MTEHHPTNHEEDEPGLYLNIGDKEVLATRGNTTLFTFAGNLATRNHIFIVTAGQEEEAESLYGSYIFSYSPAFEPIMEFMWTHDYPMHLNLQEVADCDESAFLRFVEDYAHQEGETIPNELPDDFK